MGCNGVQMSKFFIDSQAINNNNITIIGDDVQHIKKVLRAKAGEELIICDGNGWDYKVVISSMNEKEILCNIVSKNLCETEPPIKVVLFQGVPKADKMELIIQKCVELGITEIIPVKTERTVVKFENKKDEEKKQQRWQKIATEAAKQCNRGRLPTVGLPVDFKTVLQMKKDFDLLLMPYENESKVKLKNTLKDSTNAKTFGIFIGPEGGFSEEEVEKCKNNEFVPITLGKRILRTETAGLAVLSILMYELGDVG